MQLAVNLGCRVIGIADSDEKCAFVESLRAERCINYKLENIELVLSNSYKDEINVVVDTVGGVIFDAMVDNIAPLGRVIVSGYASEIVEGHNLLYIRKFMKNFIGRGHQYVAL